MLVSGGHHYSGYVCRQSGVTGDVYLPALPLCQACPGRAGSHWQRTTAPKEWVLSPLAPTVCRPIPRMDPTTSRPRLKTWALPSPIVLTKPRTPPKPLQPPPVPPPDFFVFDQDKKLVYRGQLDDSRPSKWRAGYWQGSAGGPGCSPGRSPPRLMSKSPAWVATLSGLLVTNRLISARRTLNKKIPLPRSAGSAPWVGSHEISNLGSRVLPNGS